MRPIEILDHAPTHSMSFDEFEAHAIVACVRDGPSGRVVVDVDAPGWVGLGGLRTEASRAFIALGYARSAVESLTNRLVESMSEDFDEDCKSFRLELGRPVVLVKERAVRGLGVREILRRVYAASLAAVEAPQAQHRADSTSGAEALC